MSPARREEKENSPENIEDGENDEEIESTEVDTKMLLLEIQRMRIQMNKTQEQSAAKIKDLTEKLSLYSDSHDETKYHERQVKNHKPSPDSSSLKYVPEAHSSLSSVQNERPQHLPEDQKLANNAHSDASLWRYTMKNRINRFHNSFFDDTHRREFIYENTRDDAAKFLRSYILEPPPDWSPIDLINFAADAFIDPAKHENATAEFERLIMSSDQLFWDFWTEYRTLAADAEYRDDRFLREQLRSKVLIRLSNAVQTEWIRCRTLNDYVRVLQEADAHYQFTQHRQKRNSYSNFSPATVQGHKQTARSMAYKELSISARNKPDGSVSFSGYPRTSHNLPKSEQRGNFLTSSHDENKKSFQNPGRIYEINSDFHEEELEHEDLSCAEEKNLRVNAPKKDEA